MDTIGKRLFTDESMAGDLFSEPVSLNNMNHIGIHCKWTGTPSGNIYFEVSGVIGEPGVGDWEVLDSAAVAGAGTQFWIDRNAPYAWARVKYIASGSTGLLTAHAITKGDK